MLRVKLARSYRSQKGNTVFVYELNAKPEEIAEYKAAQADQYRETENGTPLWFTTRCIGNSGTIIITSKNKIVPDMSAFEQAASLAQQFGGNFGAELAKASAAALLGNTPSSDPEIDG